MNISSISLTNFRNYGSFDLLFNKEGNVFYGDNGIGKTNLLEAIYYFAYGKSFRSNSDIDLIKHDEDYFRIEGKFESCRQFHTFEAALDRNKRKLIKIDGHRIEKISELLRLLKIVFFSQEDINLIGGTPKKRRQFFDLAISQIDFHYVDILKKYHQTVKQRNILLKSDWGYADKRPWDEILVETAEIVINYRKRYLNRVNDELSHTNINQNLDSIKLKYRCSFSYSPKYSFKDQFIKELKKIEQEEINMQRTLIGPHLDDYIFMMNDRNINRFGSHGQKRCFVLMLGLVHSRLLSGSDNDTAIMIFDDVLSDLDCHRTKSILMTLNDTNQIFIATPNPEPYKDLNLPLFNLQSIIEQKISASTHIAD